MKGSGIAGRASSVGLRRRRLRPSRTVKRFYALQKAVRSSRRADTRVCPAGYAETTAYALNLLYGNGAALYGGRWIKERWFIPMTAREKLLPLLEEKGADCALLLDEVSFR